jgi:putative N6-adenine-specific DNA methylase
MEDLFVPCTPGLEGALGQELEALGASGHLVAGGAEVEGPPGTCVRINRWSRIGSRVLLRLGELTHPDAFTRLSLAPYRAPGQAVWVDAFGEQASRWAEGAQRAWGAAPESPDALAIQLRGHGGRCTVSLDTSGLLLHFRGYRQEVGRAPLRETLAAGVLRLCGYDPAVPLWDVMCGSGTILIEAAEQALGLAPGRQRSFAFERFPTPLATLPEPALQKIDRPVLLGSDLNAGALGTARRNARRAGVFEALTLERLDATKLVARALPPGLVLANLPYGKRVGERDELGTLYAALGRSLRTACPGWRFGFLLEQGAERLGLPIEQRFEVGNGGLQCEVVTGLVPA